jgi:hypothetical protein
MTMTLDVQANGCSRVQAPGPVCGKKRAKCRTAQSNPEPRAAGELLTILELKQCIEDDDGESGQDDRDCKPYQPASSWFRTTWIGRVTGHRRPSLNSEATIAGTAIWRRPPWRARYRLLSFFAQASLYPLPSAGVVALVPRRPPALPRAPALDRTRDRGHVCVELRTLKVVSVVGFGFANAAQVVQVTPMSQTCRPDGGGP